MHDVLSMAVARAPLRSLRAYLADAAATDRAGAALAPALAGGMVVTPGFVDVHTHFDGQITWDPMLTPSWRRA